MNSSELKFFEKFQKYFDKNIKKRLLICDCWDFENLKYPDFCPFCPYLKTGCYNVIAEKYQAFIRIKKLKKLLK